MRFLHAADVHLDSPLRGLDTYEGAPVDDLRGATRKAFTSLVQLALDERVDFVVLAGDLYDGDWPDYNTGHFFVNEMRRLERSSIPVILISGNHDAASRITSRLPLPSNVHQLPTKVPGTVRLEQLRVACHGQGFARQAETRNLVTSYPLAIPDYFNIGVLHTALEGREGHDRYCPCSKEELIALGYDYWALGHVHVRESVNADRHPRIEFPGNIQGRNIREAGEKGCLLVSVNEHRECLTDFRSLDLFRWETVEVDATQAESINEVLDLASAALDSKLNSVDGRRLSARVVIACSETVCRTLAQDPQQFRANLRSLAGLQVWIEKIKLNPVPAAIAGAALSEDASSELQSVVADLRGDLETTRAITSAGECGKLLNRLPADVRSALGDSWDDVFTRTSALLQLSECNDAQ
ncbi:MAG: exonuclease SbcCD subunit D [Gemmataceae bacterium]